MWGHTRCYCCCIPVYVYIRMGVCKLCYARNSPWPQCRVLELAFSTAKIRSFSKANGRLSATWNTSLLDLLVIIICDGIRRIPSPRAIIRARAQACARARMIARTFVRYQLEREFRFILKPLATCWR